ncbi:hypothetical protein G6F68_015795 [Rhizopus microsporus]|nr:hypothetical protein G6F68_015795 [Rhizopus microsporus]
MATVPTSSARRATPVRTRRPAGTAYFREECEGLGSARNQLLARLRDRQTGIARLEVGQHRHVLVDQFAQAAHQAGTFLGGRVRPFGESVRRGGHGGIDLGVAARGDLVNGIAGGRVIGDEAVCAVDLPAIDPMFDAHVRSSCIGRLNLARVFN